MSKSKKTAGVPVAASSSVEQPRPGNGDELAANRARLVEPAADADRQLLQRALDAFKDIGYMHTAIAAQCGVLWQLAYSQGDADDQGCIEALLTCLEKLDRVAVPMIFELAEASAA